MDSDGRGQFAAELRRWRDCAGLSLGELAGRAHVNRGYVGHIEHGQRWPSHSVTTALDDALDARGALLAAWTVGDCAAPPTVVETGSDDEVLSLPLAEWTAADGEALAERLAVGSDRALTPTAARRLVHEWLVTETPQTVEITAGRRIGMGMVDTVTRRVAQLRRVDDFIAGRELQPLVERELRATARLLREAAYTDRVGRALLSAVAELCQLAGWVTVDANAPERAARHLALGVHAAHAAGDRPTAANLISTLAYQVANRDDPHEAVLLARSATAGAHGHASATTRALLEERVAWAHAGSAIAGTPSAHCPPSTPSTTGAVRLRTQRGSIGSTRTRSPSWQAAATSSWDGPAGRSRCSLRCWSAMTSARRASPPCTRRGSLRHTCRSGKSNTPRRSPRAR